MFKRRSYATLLACAALVVGCSATPSPTSTTPSPTGSSAPTADRPAIGAVVATEPLVLRTAPGTGADSTILETRLYPGMRFSILEGPEMASGYAWFLVRIGEVEGWAAAASKEGDPWLASVRNGAVAISRDLPAPGGIPHPQVILLDEDGVGRQITFLTAEEVTRRTAIPAAALRPVLTCGYGIYEASWSPAGDQLVAAVGSCETAIFAVDTTGETLRWLGQGTGPSWSPAGTDVAHAVIVPYLPCGRQCGGEPLGPWEITVTDAATGQSRPLTSNEAWFQAFEPDWAPDGTRLAFTGGEYGAQAWGVHLVNADGTDQRRLVDGFGASWSPDGTRLLFVRPNAAQEPETWLMEADGSSEQRLGGGWAALWSPDGTWIALRNTDQQVVLVSADGTDQMDLGDGMPQGWSPDGRYLMVSRGDIPARLIAIDLSDRSERVVAEFGEDMWSYLGWQPLYEPLTP